jgi:hypothetical protein
MRSSAALNTRDDALIATAGLPRGRAASDWGSTRTAITIVRSALGGALPGEPGSGGADTG